MGADFKSEVGFVKEYMLPKPPLPFHCDSIDPRSEDSLNLGLSFLLYFIY